MADFSWERTADVDLEQRSDKPPRQQPVYRITSLTGESFQAEIQAMTNQELILATGKKFSVEELLTLETTETTRPAFPTSSLIILANGDRLQGKVLRGDRRTLTISPALVPKQELTLKLGSVVAWWQHALDKNFPFRVEDYPWFQKNPKDDIIKLKNEDVVLGRVDSFSDKGMVRFRGIGEKTPRPYTPDLIHCVAFSPTFARMKKPTLPYFHLTLADGSLLTAQEVLLERGSWKLILADDASLTLPLAAMQSIELVHKQVQLLTDRTPSSEQFIPFASLRWPWQKNQTLDQRPLSLKQGEQLSVYRNGLALHSRTILTYDLPEEYSKLYFQAGLDPKRGQRGAALLKISSDNNKKFEKVLDQHAPICTVIHDLTQARKLILELDFGPGGDVQDHVNIIYPRLLRK